VSQAWSDKAQQMHAALREDPQVLEAARQDSELEPVVRKLDEVIERLVAADRNEQGAELSDSAKEGLQHEVSELLSILAIELARKNMNFDESVVAPARNEPATPTSPWQRLLHVLSSDRFTQDLGLVRKPLSHVATALVVLSLIGWTAEPLADSLHLPLNRLRINAVDQQAQRELDEAVSKADAAKPEAVADEPAPSTHTAQSAARLVARAAVEQMTRSGVLDHLAQVERAPQNQAVPGVNYPELSASTILSGAVGR
jgi:hypothetical protein